MKEVPPEIAELVKSLGAAIAAATEEFDALCEKLDEIDPRWDSAEASEGN
jgi:hypothetical protein